MHTTCLNCFGVENKKVSKVYFEMLTQVQSDEPAVEILIVNLELSQKYPSNVKPSVLASAFLGSILQTLCSYPSSKLKQHVTNQNLYIYS